MTYGAFVSGAASQRIRDFDYVSFSFHCIYDILVLMSFFYEVMIYNETRLSIHGIFLNLLAAIRVTETTPHALEIKPNHTQVSNRVHSSPISKSPTKADFAFATKTPAMHSRLKTCHGPS
jgi:hypothetical protein